MTYIRKTEDEHQIWQESFIGGKEHLTTESKYSEAKLRVREYRENAPGPRYYIKTVRVKKQHQS